MPRLAPYLVALLLVPTWASPVAAAPTPAQRCEVAVELASGKFAQCRLRAEATFSTSLDVAKRASALARCSDRLTLAMAKAISKYGTGSCTSGMAPEYETYLAQCTDDTAAAAAAGGMLPRCGNGVLDVAGEQCDGADLGEDSCQRLGFAGGDLGCDSTCRLLTSGCLLPVPTPTAVPTPTPSPVPTETPVPTPTVVADSVADFSSVQGQAGWMYGYYATPPDSGTFQQIPAFEPTYATPSTEGAWLVDKLVTWAAIWQTGQHPGAETMSCGKQVTADWTVRRWTSDVAGQVRLAGHVGKQVDGFDGAIARIIVDGLEIYTRAVDGSDVTGVDYEVFANVNFGSHVDFVVSPHGSDCNDSIGFSAVIEFLP